MTPKAAKKLLASLGHYHPEAGDCSSKTLKLEGGLVAEIQINVKRSPDASEREEALAAALATLDRNPRQANRCACVVQRRERFTSYRADCSNRPAAVAVSKGTLYGTRLERFVCTTHAGKLEKDGCLVVRIPQRKLKAARARAKALEERRYVEETGAEAIGEALFAAARVGERKSEGVVDELAARRRRKQQG